MDEIDRRVRAALEKERLSFADKPVLIGGLAMEYYGMRRAGMDIDLVITDADYQRLAIQYPEKRKDLYGDLGLVIGPFEIWRSITLLDYSFFGKEAVEGETVKIISIDRLLWTRVCAMEVEKYRRDLELMKEFYYRQYTNPSFKREAEKHTASYQKKHGAVFGGEYED